jgi:hypothetical protein
MAQTSISGRLFENSLREMVSTLVWHNKYLGDKYDTEDRYVDAVEVDTYLTGARHLLMTYKRTDLENVENMSEDEYMSYRELEFTSPDANTNMPYWDMFYYGTKIEYDRDPLTGLLVVDRSRVGYHKKYEEKNTYYRELYGLPAYAGTIAHCNTCENEWHGYTNGSVCPKCGSNNIDPTHTAPSMYSGIALFPKYTNKPVNTEWNRGPIYRDLITDWVYPTQNEEGTLKEEYPKDGASYTNAKDANGKQIRMEYNPLVYIYLQPLRERIYAEFSTTFIKDCLEKVTYDRHYRYLKHLTYAKIHPFVARLSDRFEILYIQDADIATLGKDFREVYEECRLYMKYRYYTEAFRNQYKEYEGFIGLSILFMALQRMQAKYLETDITRDFYDLESIEVVYNAYSVPFYDDIPVTYHTKIIKAINILLSKKGSNACFKDIFAIFGYSTLNMYQYYILKTQKLTGNGTPMYYYDDNGNEVPEQMYDVRIVKADIGENPYSYIIDSMNYLNYYGVTEPDTYWLNDDDLLYKLYHSEYNFLETKYIGIEMAFSLTRFTIETEYIMRMLLDNKTSGNNGTNQLTVYHGNLGIEIDVYTLVLYIMYIVGKEFGLSKGGSLKPLTDPIKLSNIYGFNFIEDLTVVYGYLSRQFIYNYKPGIIVKETDGSYYFKPVSYEGYTPANANTVVLYNAEKEAELNKLDVNNDDFTGFYQYVLEYISIGYLKPITMGNFPEASEAERIRTKLVIAFNGIKHLLESYTDEEAKMKNLLDFRFVKVYYSDSVCSFCGVPREDLNNQFEYCHNTACYSNHDYLDGNGPLLRDMRGRIPSVKEIDTSKDTEDKIFRNQVYAEFVTNYELINPFIVTIIRRFNTYPQDVIDMNESLTEYIAFDRDDTDIIYVLGDVSNVLPGNTVRLEHRSGQTVISVDEAKVVDILSSTYDVEPPDELVVRYHQILINKKVSYKVNDIVDIKYRNVNVTYDEWCYMMTEGVKARVAYEASSKRLAEMEAEKEIDPSAYTDEEMQEQRDLVHHNQYNYTHSLYYLIGVISEFIDCDEDIDLFSEDYIWSEETTIGQILIELNMYNALVGLRTKREFRLFISDQIEELTPIALDPNNAYYTCIDDIRWIALYLRYYFLDKTKTTSELSKTIDDFFLYDNARYMSEFSYRHSSTQEGYQNNRANVAYSYMNDTMTQVLDPITHKPINVFDYIKNHIRDIIDADRNISDINDYEISIGIGRGVDKDWSKLQSSYNAIVELHNEFTKLTWGIKNPKAFHAMRRLNKMLMTTKYAQDVYKLKGSDTVAESYKDLLDSINPMLTLRIDNMTEKQRITELEYSLSYLDKISDDLLYLHAYGGFNMKKILSYIWKMIYFFKSAKVDLLHYALEFRVDDKTDNLMKYMSELTKLNTETKVTPDQWRMTDVAAMHEITTRLNIDKSIKLTFSDALLAIGKYKNLFSANYMMDQIVSHTHSQVEASDLNYHLYDYMKHNASIRYIGRSGNWNIPSLHPDAQKPYNASDSDISAIDKIRKYQTNNIIRMPEISYNEAYSIDKVAHTDTLQLVKRVVYEFDLTQPYTTDEHGNKIYPYKLDENNNRIPVVFESDDEYRDWLYANDKAKWWQYFGELYNSSENISI